MVARRLKGAHRYLKMAFHHAAIRAVQYFPEVKAEFQRWQQRKGKPIARAPIAKKLATIVFATLSKDEPFNKQFHGRAVTTTTRCTWPRLANPPASLSPSRLVALIGEPGGMSTVNI